MRPTCSWKEEHGARKPGRRAILEDTIADVQASDADVSAVRGFEAVGQGVAVGELRDLEESGPGTGRPARSMAGTVELPFVADCGGERRRESQITSA